MHRPRCGLAAVGLSTPTWLKADRWPAERSGCDRRRVCSGWHRSCRPRPGSPSFPRATGVGCPSSFARRRLSGDRRAASSRLLPALTRLWDPSTGNPIRLLNLASSRHPPSPPERPAGRLHIERESFRREACATAGYPGRRSGKVVSCLHPTSLRPTGTGRRWPTSSAPFGCRSKRRWSRSPRTPRPDRGRTGTRTAFSSGWLADCDALLALKSLLPWSRCSGCGRQFGAFGSWRARAPLQSM